MRHLYLYVCLVSFFSIFAGKVQMPSKEALVDQLKQAKLDYFAKKLDLTNLANKELDPWEVPWIMHTVFAQYGKQVDSNQYAKVDEKKYDIIKALLVHSPEALKELEGYI